jgi:RNA polymerase sigma-70 factor (ECF subfamily)
MNREVPTFTGGSRIRTEPAVIASARRGDEAAFQMLFESHKFRVYSLCLRMTANAADAEDLTQQAFLKAFAGISTFRGESAFSTWLHRLALNEVLRHRRKKRVPEVPFAEVHNSDGHTVVREYPEEDRRLTRAPSRVDLFHAMAQLPRSYQMALVLFEVHGYKHHEIARMMNCSVGSSKSNLHRARRRLRLALM